jgi:hypothetical protein
MILISRAPLLESPKAQLGLAAILPSANGRMPQTPHPAQIAMLSVGFAVIALAITLPQRLGDWRSKVVARVLLAVALTLTVCWIYFAALWIFGIDLLVWIQGQPIWFWVLVALSTAALFRVLNVAHSRAEPQADLRPILKPEVIYGHEMVLGGMTFDAMAVDVRNIQVRAENLADRVTARLEYVHAHHTRKTSCRA